MKVRDLVEELLQCPQNAEVIISRDSEGNDYNPIDQDFSVGYWNPTAGELEWEEDGGPSPSSVLALVIYPV